MTIKAIWRIKAGREIYEPGAVVTGLSPDEERRLIELGAAIPFQAINEVVNANGSRENSAEVDALQALLKALTKKDLLVFAEHAGVDANEKMKNDEIIEAILQDARQNGVDLEAMTDEQLIQFAKHLGIEGATAELGREDLLNTIEAHFEG